MNSHSTQPSQQPCPRCLRRGRAGSPSRAVVRWEAVVILTGQAYPAGGQSATTRRYKVSGNYGVSSSLHGPIHWYQV